MMLHEEVNVLTYGASDSYGFKLHYLLNEGMAFGYRLESKFGKLILTVFRILAMAGIAYYLWKMIKKNMHPGFLWCMGLILGGAIGNVIDSTFYGVLLNNQPLDAPSPWFHGQVIDMLHFPLFRFDWPQWMPFIGGKDFLFFSPVFNIADSSIFIGVLFILLKQKKFFKDEKKDDETIANQQAMPLSTASDDSSVPPAVATGDESASA
jgi:signal peptidase II